MTPDQLTQLATFGAILLIVGIIAIIVRQKMKIKRVWRELAEHNNLELREGRYPSVKGEIDGRQIELGSHIGLSLLAENPDPKMPVQFYAWAELKGKLPEQFAAGRKGLFQGDGPVVTDNPAFNKKLWVHSSDVESALTYLTPERQEAILKLLKYAGEVYGRQDQHPPHVFMKRAGYNVKTEWLEERKKALLDAATVLDNV